MQAAESRRFSGKSHFTQSHATDYSKQYTALLIHIYPASFRRDAWIIVIENVKFRQRARLMQSESRRNCHQRRLRGVPIILYAIT
jgi:hypothetical protein